MKSDLGILPPAPLKPDAGPFHKLQHMCKVQQYNLYKIQQLQLAMEDLARNVEKESPTASDILRAFDFRHFEMTYLGDSRRCIGKQSDLVTPADIQEEGNLD